jgi:hypothetical protein
VLRAGSIVAGIIKTIPYFLEKNLKKMLTRGDRAGILNQQNKEGYASASPPAAAKRSTSL